MNNVLEKIVAAKHHEIAETRARTPEHVLERRLADMPPSRDFRGALDKPGRMSIIAEVKKASPSAGVICADFDPIRIARTYADAGADCISVLTDEPFFQGKLEYLSSIRKSVDCPLLRKDFILDRIQLLEARLAGADAALLIAEILPGDLLPRLMEQAREIGLQTLVELYDADNLPRVIAGGAKLIGINNRDLRTFVTSLDHTLDLAAHIPPDCCLVSESGIRTREDIATLKKAGVRACLIGETLMRTGDVRATMQALRG